MKKLRVFTLFVAIMACPSFYGQSLLKKDSTNTLLLGFSKRSPWTLSLTDSIQFPSIALRDFPDAPDGELIPKMGMPVHRPDENCPMPVHKPDSTINYKMKIFDPQIFREN